MTEDMKWIEIYCLKPRGLFNTLRKQRIWNSPIIFDLKTCSISIDQRPEIVRKSLNLYLITIMLFILLLSWSTRFTFTISTSCRGCKCNYRFSMTSQFMPNDNLKCRAARIWFQASWWLQIFCIGYSESGMGNLYFFP